MQRNRGKQLSGKNRDLVKKIRDTKGSFHAKMGSIKTEMVWTEQKKKILRSGKNSQKNCTRKIFMTQTIKMM